MHSGGCVHGGSIAQSGCHELFHGSDLVCHFEVGGKNGELRVTFTINKKFRKSFEGDQLLDVNNLVVHVHKRERERMKRTKSKVCFWLTNIIMEHCIMI